MDEGLFFGYSDEEIALARMLYECGGACLRQEWSENPKKGKRMIFRPNPPFADVYNYNPDYPTNIPKAVLRKIKQRPLTRVYVAFSDVAWRQVREYFKSEEGAENGRKEAAGVDARNS